MPQVPFDSLPESSRVWVFGSTRLLVGEEADGLLAEVDRFLPRWQAHGEPLYSGRDLSHGRFLTIAVDQSTAGASGCSIDGLYRSLRAVEAVLAIGLLGGGTLFYRDEAGTVQGVSRATFGELARAGEIGPDTPVFDLSVETLGDWRARFEQPARRSWHARLLPRAASGT